MKYRRRCGITSCGKLSAVITSQTDIKVSGVNVNIAGVILNIACNIHHRTRCTDMTGNEHTAGQHAGECHCFNNILHHFPASLPATSRDMT